EEWAPCGGAWPTGRGSQQSKYGLGLAVSTPPDQPDAPEAVVGCIGRGNTGEIWRVALASDGSGAGTQTLAGSVPEAQDFLIDASGRRVVVETAGNGQA